MILEWLVAAALSPVAVFMGITLFWKLQALWLKLPPGPLRLPMIGNSWYFQMRKRQGVFSPALMDRVYKDLLSVYTRNGLTVMLMNDEVIQEVFVKQAAKVSSKYPVELKPNPNLDLINSPGMAELDGRWQPLRRLVLLVLKEKGVAGKDGTMEERIKTEIGFYIQTLRATEGAPVDIKDLLFQAVSNVINYIICGDRFDYSSEQKEIMQFLEYVDPGTSVNLHTPLPISLKEARKKAEAAIGFFRQQIEEHRKTLDKEHPRDYIDAFLIEMDKNSDSDDSVFTEGNMLSLLLSLYTTATDTLSISFCWAFLHLLIFPEAQDKIYEEIQRVAGDRELTYNDRHKMDYTMSFMVEVLRICVSTTSLPYFTTDEIHVRGYIIPKGTQVMGNIWNSCKNDANFKDGQSFIPDRFLDANGKFQKPDVKKVIPFGVGRRSCLGEALAKMELFFFLTSTIRHFRLESGQNTPLSKIGTLDLVYEPKPYRIKFIPRC